MSVDPSRAKAPPPLEELLRVWGLRRTPFAPDERSREIFSSDSHREALELMSTTAALRGVMLLTGPPGSGKSTVLKNWVATLEPKRHLPLFITQASLSATGVLEIILAKLGERPRFKRSANLLVLEKHLADLEPVSPVLILDDAQNYPSQALEEVRMLLGLGGRSRSAFSLILLGDEYLLDSLRLSLQRALFSRVSAAAKLTPLPPHDIPAYLNWHVSQAGLDRDIFANPSIDLLAEASEAIPRTLNLLAQAAWFAAARAGESVVSPTHVHQAIRLVPSALAKITAS